MIYFIKYEDKFWLENLYEKRTQDLTIQGSINTI